MSTLPTFLQEELLTTALTHRSALNEKNSTAQESNERLEFLGDAVLELATTKYLYVAFPREPEGTLTAYRSALVKTTSLAQVAQSLELGERIYMSKGEEASGGRSNESLLANTFEAVVGALYLDQGFESVEQFLTEHLFLMVDEILKKGLYRDAKSHLQEVVQAKGLPTPTYEVIKEVGPDHDKEFTIRALVGTKVIGVGIGKSKQLAQQAAAQAALAHYT
jgi:ribonuclease III